MKGPGGYHNVSLKVGPPLTSDDRGRYVCLVNNPQGHKHKEIFLKVANYSSTSKNNFFDPVNPGKKKYRKLGLLNWPLHSCLLGSQLGKWLIKLKTLYIYYFVRFFSQVSKKQRLKNQTFSLDRWTMGSSEID